MAKRPLSASGKYATLFSLIIPKLISLSMHYSIYLISVLFFVLYLFIFNLSALISLSRNICFILIAMHSRLLLLLLRLRLCCFSRICLVLNRLLLFAFASFRELVILFSQGSATLRFFFFLEKIKVHTKNS